MLMRDINFLLREMNMPRKLPKYLELKGAMAKWYFIDKRTKKIDGYYRVYPIGIGYYSFYVINPYTGSIQSHGYTVDDYTGHRSQNYIIHDLKELENPSQEDRELLRKMENIKRCKKERNLIKGMI